MISIPPPSKQKCNKPTSYLLCLSLGPLLAWITAKASLPTSLLLDTVLSPCMDKYGNYLLSKIYQVSNYVALSHILNNNKKNYPSLMLWPYRSFDNSKYFLNLKKNSTLPLQGPGGLFMISPLPVCIASSPGSSLLPAYTQTLCQRTTHIPSAFDS